MKEDKTTISEKKTWGGKREGAGRPHSPKGAKKLIAFRADEDVLADINAHPNKSEYINSCIRMSFNGKG